MGGFNPPKIICNRTFFSTKSRHNIKKAKIGQYFRSEQPHFAPFVTNLVRKKFYRKGSGKLEFDLALRRELYL